MVRFRLKYIRTRERSSIFCVYSPCPRNVTHLNHCSPQPLPPEKNHSGPEHEAGQDRRRIRRGRRGVARADGAPTDGGGGGGGGRTARAIIWPPRLRQFGSVSALVGRDRSWARGCSTAAAAAAATSGTTDRWVKRAREKLFPDISVGLPFFLLPAAYDVVVCHTRTQLRAVYLPRSLSSRGHGHTAIVSGTYLHAIFCRRQFFANFFFFP